MKDLSFGNIMATPLGPVDTGDAAADDAIRRLQAWPHSPYNPFPHPGGSEYEACKAAAARVDPERLVPLLDDAAVATGVSRWSDEHFNSLTAAQRKQFKNHYEAVLAALATRKGYLWWLIGAVCRTEAGFARALEVAQRGATTARQAAAEVLLAHRSEPEALRRLADALDLRRWDGEDPELERTYRAGVCALAEADPALTFDRYASLLDGRDPDSPAYTRSEALLFGLANAGRRAAEAGRGQGLDPRWTAVMVPLLQTELDNLALAVLEQLPPDPALVDPLCAYLPPPSQTKAWWPDAAVRLLARVAEPRALPWLIGALRSSWMNWPAAFEGFRKAGDPAMAHVIRDWLKDNPGADRKAAAREVIAELEAHGRAPKAAAPVFEPEPAPVRTRPTLVYAKTPAFKPPKLDSLAALTKLYRKRFAAAELDEHFEALAQPALYLLPKRVDEAKLELGGTKLGGHPDLPAKAVWPRVEGEPLTFLAQIDLAEVFAVLGKSALPRSGLLSLFLSNDPNGAAGYCEHAKALYTPARAKLVRREVPEDFVDLIYQAATVKLHPTLSLPSPDNRHVCKRLRGAKLQRYADQAFDDTAPLLPQLLGFRRHGYDAEEKATSQLLLQLPGDDQTTMEFGDVDALSIYIHERKLAERDFGKVWPRIGD